MADIYANPYDNPANPYSGPLSNVTLIPNNLTDVQVNAIYITERLNPIADCAIAASWYWFHGLNNSDGGGFAAGWTSTISPYTNDTINLEFLRMAVLPEYQNNSEALEILQNELAYTAWNRYANDNSGIPNGGWIWNAIWAIEFYCIGPSLSFTLQDLKTNIDCGIVTPFFDSQGFAPGDAYQPQYYAPIYSTEEYDFWNSFLQAAQGSYIPDYTIRGWYHNQFITGHYPDMVWFLKWALYACADEQCEYSGFSGNPDIAGVGVIASYLFAAGIVTLFFYQWLYMMAVQQVCAHTKDRTDEEDLEIEPMFRKSIEAAIESAAFLLLAVSVALEISKQSLTVYTDLVCSAAQHILSMSLCLIILITDQNSIKDRFWGISVVWIVSLSIALKTRLTDDVDSHIGVGGESYCFQRAIVPNGFTNTFSKLNIVLTWFFAILFVLFLGVWGPWNRWMPTSERKKLRLKVGRILFGILLNGIIWWLVWVVSDLRSTMKSIAGTTWAEAEWGFGQVVAILAWLPVVLAFGRESFAAALGASKTLTSWHMKGLGRFSWGGDDEEESISKATSRQGINSPNILQASRDPDPMVVTGAPPLTSEESEPESGAAIQRSPSVGDSTISSATEAPTTEIFNRASTPEPPELEESSAN